MKKLTALMLTLAFALLFLPSYALDVITYAQNAVLRIAALESKVPYSITLISKSPNLFAEEETDPKTLYWINTCAGTAHVDPEGLEIVAIEYQIDMGNDKEQNIRDIGVHNLIAGVATLENHNATFDNVLSQIGEHPLTTASNDVSDWMGIAIEKIGILLNGEEIIVKQSDDWTYSLKLFGDHLTNEQTILTVKATANK